MVRVCNIRFYTTNSVAERARRVGFPLSTIVSMLYSGSVGLLTEGLVRVGNVNEPQSRLFFDSRVWRGDGDRGIELLNLLRFIRFSGLTRLDGLVDLFAVDRLGNTRVYEHNRFSVTYVFNVSGFGLVSCLFDKFKRLRRLKFSILQGDSLNIPSVVAFWSGAEWAERELWDMSGLRFSGHPDLRRLLTDYGFRGFPMRKEFPTFGFKQVRYDETTDSVVYEPVILVQNEREGRLVNPWSYGSELPSLMKNAIPFRLF